MAAFLSSAYHWLGAALSPAITFAQAHPVVATSLGVAFTLATLRWVRMLSAGSSSVYFDSQEGKGY